MNTVATVAILPVDFLTLGESHRWLRAAGLDHRNALAIDRCHQDGTDRRFRGTFPIKSVKIVSRIPQYLLQAALGDRNAGEVGDGVDGFGEGILHRGLDQAARQFVGERAGGQGESLVEWIDAGCAGSGVAHADDIHRSKDGFEGAGAEAAMGVPDLAGLLFDAQRSSHNSGSAVLQVSLKQQALHLAALGLWLTLNLVEGAL